MMHNSKSRTGLLVVSYISSIEIKGGVKSVGDDLLRKIMGQLLIVRNFTVDDCCAIDKRVAGELAERVADIIQIFEKVQMFSFYI